MSVAPKLLHPAAGVLYKRPFTRRRFVYQCLNPSTGSRGSRGRGFQLPRVASVPYQPINVDYLEEEFNGIGHGVRFEGIGDECAAKLRLENGGSAIVMFPSGLITSYKSPMWHGGSLELLHSSVCEDENGDVIVRGGVSLALDCGSIRLDDVCWTLHDVKGNPRESIQVELISRAAEGKVELKYIVTLGEDMLTSELVVSNNEESAIQLKGSVLSHLTVSTPEATYAIGLEGSDFYSRAPFSSSYSIVPPDYGQGSGSGLRRTWNGILPGWGKSKEKESEEEVEGEEGEETDNYKQLTEEMSRIYTSAPRNFTIIDRGRRNSVVVGRDGFDELYMFSPGSNHVYYGEYSFICVGHSAMLKSILLEPHQVWRGSQSLFNPNL
ncbi:protein NDH-DEPENDENT CYCLIC ELECTRON FLOW 5 [Cucurbita maxima]|uniref:Protein NDH-DEPENDENT CYCLIC ELECTRON FLOW 5 n=1 Tax=Cucurbita maxima TaxID=3661 RepID=A0A6J1HRF2_CUCMA|nr:protein NDH-DEPENDENT CYCLIC ELECTRON FLOW 5 [Cucurbita maxima]